MALARLMIACAVGWAAVACSGNTFLSSPDGNITITVEHALSEEGVSVLRVSVHGDELMEISAVGLVAEETVLCSGFEVKCVDRERVNTTWTQPWKVTARTGPYLLHPETIYECTGDVPNVCFPCAALHDPDTGRVAVYYGCADTVVGLAFGYIPEIIDFTKHHNIV